MKEFFATLLQAVLTAAVPVISAFLVQELRSRTIATNSEAVNNYTELILGAVSDAVLCINQTYVDKQKDEATFDIQSQEKALKMALAEAKRLLTQEAKEFAVKAYGDIDAYLTTLIEAQVKTNKMVG